MFQKILNWRVLVWAIVFGYIGFGFGGKGADSITLIDNQIYYGVGAALLGGIIGFLLGLLGRKNTQDNK